MHAPLVFPLKTVCTRLACGASCRTRTSTSDKTVLSSRDQLWPHPSLRRNQLTICNSEAICRWFRSMAECRASSRPGVLATTSRSFASSTIHIVYFWSIIVKSWSKIRLRRQLIYLFNSCNKNARALHVPMHMSSRPSLLRKGKMAVFRNAIESSEHKAERSILAPFPVGPVRRYSKSYRE